MATARPSPSAKESSNAATTRASVIRTKSARSFTRLAKMRCQPGTMNGGANSDATCHATARISSPITISRGKRNGARASSASTVSPTIASSLGIRSRASRLVDRALVRQLRQVAGVHRDLEHLPDGRPLALPRGLHIVDHPARGDGLLQHPGRQLHGADHDAIRLVEVGLDEALTVL